jgi:ABC-type nitrate/sulfonate/bicarbonate transport system permease component
MWPLTRGLVVKLAAVCAVVALWQLASSGLHIPLYLVPEPAAVFASFLSNIGTLAPRTLFTVGSAALGLMASAVFASVVAIAFSFSPRAALATLPVVIAFRSAPIVAIAPLIMLCLGRGIGTSIVVVTIVSFFPLLVGFMKGLTAGDRTANELLHVYGASWWQSLRFVRIPFAMPLVFTGLRISGASAILGAILSEWITGSRGLGDLILESSEMRATELLWATVLTCIAIALIVFWVTSAAENRVLHWRR